MESEKTIGMESEQSERIDLGYDSYAALLDKFYKKVFEGCGGRTKSSTKKGGNKKKQFSCFCLSN